MTEGRRELLEALKKSDAKFKCNRCEQVLQPDHYSRRQLKKAEVGESVTCLDCQQKVLFQPSVGGINNQGKRAENTATDTYTATKLEDKPKRRKDSFICVNCNTQKPRLEFSTRQLRFKDDDTKMCIECTTLRDNGQVTK